MLQFERGSHGTCDGNAPEIFDFNPRLCLHGPRKTTCDFAKGRLKRTERKAQFFAKSQIGSRGWAKGRTECQSHQAQLFAQSRARLRGRPQGRTCFAPRAEKSRRSSNEASFVKRKQSFVWFRARAPRPRGGSGWLASTTSPALDRRAIESAGRTAAPRNSGETHRPTARRFEPLPNGGKGAWARLRIRLMPVRT